LPAQWLSNSGDMPGRMTSSAAGMLHSLSRPTSVRRLRQVLLVLLLLWAVWALARLIWALFPAAEAPLQADAIVINPVSSSGAVASADDIDIEGMRAWHLFGEAGVQEKSAIAPPDANNVASAREGIEDGARKTRLDLKLRGIVASTADGMGHAIIEYKSRQSVYAVEDKLPVSGSVVLAKVMPHQVVLDNGGTYELLPLFEETTLDSQLSSLPAPAGSRQQAAGRPQAARQVDKRSEADTTALAQSYRERLYQNPQSLAEVVSVNAVREDGELLGYRIGPGKDKAQFEQLGFKRGDLVTGVNGVALNDPANAMTLYQTMRSASEAVFDLQRDNQQLTVSVSLDNSSAQ